MRPIAEAQKIYDNMYTFFVSRVKENLHVVLCMSPIGDTLRLRMRMFPSLVTCTTINWVDPWPEDALHSVSKSKMEDLVIEDMGRDQAKATRDKLALMCKETQLSV